MSKRSSRRVAVGLAPLVAAGLALSACGGSDGEAASKPTVTLAEGETSYATLPVATVTPAPTVATTDDTEAAGAGAAEQEYTIESGDNGIAISKKFGVSLEDLEAINNWSDAGTELPGIGSTIKIPAGGTTSASTDEDDDAGTPAAEPDTGTATDTDSSSDSEADSGETGDAIPEVAGNCEAGTHTVVAGDVPYRLVELYDVTLEALEAANADNPAYTRFIPGDKINLPEKDGC